MLLKFFSWIIVLIKMGSLCQSFKRDDLSDHISVEILHVPESLNVGILPIFKSPPESVYEPITELSLPSWSHNNSNKSTPRAVEQLFDSFPPTCDCSPDLKGPTLKLPRRIFN